MFAQKGSSIPTPFMVVMVCWLTLILASFSLFSFQRNRLQHLAGLRVSVSSAIFLILELDRPYDGLLQVSSALLAVLEQMGK